MTLCVDLIKNDLQEILLLIPRSPSTARTFRTWKEKNRKRKYQFICGSVLTYYRRAGGPGGGGGDTYGNQHLPPHFLSIQKRQQKQENTNLTSKIQKINFCGLLRKSEFYYCALTKFLDLPLSLYCTFFSNNNNHDRGCLVMATA